MALKLNDKYCDAAALYAILDAMAEEILQAEKDVPNLAFIGILRGGARLADHLAGYLSRKISCEIPVAYLDITLYRDDMIDSQREPYSRATEIPFSVTNKEIVLVDDVLFTGRTVRAALTSILSLGRPRLIRLAVAVDRGYREMPIQADFVGRTIETRRDQGIRVKMEGSEEDGIFIYDEV